MAGARTWYGRLSIGEKNAMWLLGGNICGCFYGTKVRMEGEEFKMSDYLRLSFLRIPPENMKDFETVWNDEARFNQKQAGYEWTTMLKSFVFEQTPFHYLCMRMWSEEGDYKRVAYFDKTQKEFNARFQEVGLTEKAGVYKVVVDDSVRRLI